MIEILKLKNKNLIDNYALQGNERLLKKQLLIKNILAEPNCFLKIQMLDAIAILVDLGYSKDSALELYKKLISPKKVNN